MGGAASPCLRGRIEEGVGRASNSVGGDPLPALPLTRRGRKWGVALLRPG